MRSGWAWVAAIAAGVVVLVGVVALVGRDDNKDETVSAGEWADTVCGAVAVYRGQIESIVDGIRDPSATGSLGTEEPQSETPQGRQTFVRNGLEQALEATETVITAIDTAGVPDTANGEQAANAISGWADKTRNDIGDAQASLDDEADTIAEAITQLTGAAKAVAAAVTTGVQAVADVGRTDPALAAALRDSSTCRQLREETTS
ncbi:MAG TPA: hypothetical protein VFJ60_03425 [Gaiella sp.]|nr:hypothetical protein [Gaiella sp.]